MPDEQFEGIVGRKVFDAKGQDAIDYFLLKAPGPAVKDKFERDHKEAQKEIPDNEHWTQEDIIKPRLLAIEYLIDIVGDIRKTLHYSGYIGCAYL